jgi:hypothetical protein
MSRDVEVSRDDEDFGHVVIEDIATDGHVCAQSFKLGAANIFNGPYMSIKLTFLSSNLSFKAYLKFKNGKY